MNINSDFINPNSEAIQFKDDIIKSMKTCHIVKIHEKEINSIDFSKDGSLIMTSGKDDLLTLIRVENFEIIQKLYNKTFGVENAIFTHHPKAILCSSNKDFRIMYWCLHNNEVIFSFLGHSDLITDICLSPISDLFITTSRDKTSRLWDLNNRKCLSIFQESNHAVFDNTGKVIASVTFESDKNNDKIINFINLYATENVLQGPFKVFKIDSNNEIKEMKFSNDGLFLICTTIENVILIVDSFDGIILKTLQGEINESDMYFKADISPDSKYVASGSESGQVHVWNVSDGKVITSLNCHPQASNCVKFSPKHSMLASSCKNLVLWHPDIKSNNQNNY